MHDLVERHSLHYTRLLLNDFLDLVYTLGPGCLQGDRISGVLVTAYSGSPSNQRQHNEFNTVQEIHVLLIR